MKWTCHTSKLKRLVDHGSKAIRPTSITNTIKSNPRNSNLPSEWLSVSLL